MKWKFSNIRICSNLFLILLEPQSYVTKYSASIWLNCISDFKMVANSRLKASISQSLKHYFLQLFSTIFETKYHSQPVANGILPKYFYTIGHIKDGLVQLMHTYVFTKVGKWHVTYIVYSHFPLWLMRKSME